MTAAEAVAQYRKGASALRRLRCWTGSSQRTKEAAVRHQGMMLESLKALRDMNLHEVESRLCAERQLLDSAYGIEDHNPEDASIKRGRAKEHQYQVRLLIKGTLMTQSTRVCAICEHPRSEHIARVGCVHEFGVEAVSIGKSVCHCEHYIAKPKGA